MPKSNFNCAAEMNARVNFVKEYLEKSSLNGIIFGNSGGKDSALVGAICSMACKNTLGVIMPCGTKQNLGSDRDDALALAEKFGIETREIDLYSTAKAIIAVLSEKCTLTDSAVANIAPRLRMTTLYTIAASEGRIVVGTGNLCERYLGYFTKWGDGAFDVNPIADLTVSEIYELLKYLDAPENIIKKQPSAGLYEGQTDEAEMGIKYSDVEIFLSGGEILPDVRAKIQNFHLKSEHKRIPPIIYKKQEV